MSNCIEGNCDSLDICEETLKCMAHCKSKMHFHCSNLCNFISFCEMSKESECIRCCFELNHSHCSYRWCESSMSCKMSKKSACIKHCYELNHSHCKNYFCTSLNLCKMSKKSECVECCYESKH